MSVQFFRSRFSSHNHPHTSPSPIAIIGHDFRQPPPPHRNHRNHRRTFEFAILNLRQTFLEIYSSQYRIRGYCNYDGRGMKIVVEEIENVGRPLKKILKCERDKSDIKPLGLAAPPIWLGNLQYGCALKAGSHELLNRRDSVAWKTSMNWWWLSH